MRILIVSPWFPPGCSAGGAPRSAWTISRGLAQAGADVHVVTTDSHAYGEVEAERVESGVRITTAAVIGGEQLRRYAFAPGLVPALWAATRRVDVCVLQGIWTFPAALAPRICRLRHVPYVVCPRGTLLPIALATRAGKKNAYFRLVESSTLRNAAAVLYASAFEQRMSRAVRGGPPGHVVPNALDDLGVVGPESGRPAFRAGLPADAILVGMAGRIHPNKGFDVIVPAFARVDAPLHLVCFGDDTEGHWPAVRRLAEQQGVQHRVHNLGFLEADALRAAYASLDLLVLPSRGESFGNVVVEALAQGTDVLVSNQVGVAEYLAGSGLGTVVPSLAPRDWTGALADWMKRRAEFDGDRAIQVVRRDFDPAATGRRLLAELERIIASKQL